MSNIRDCWTLPVGNFPFNVVLSSYIDVQHIRLSAHIDNAPDTESLIWDLKTDYTYPIAADVNSLAIASNDAADTAGSTGARKIQINGLDSNYGTISETVSMNGLTPIQLTESFYRFNNIEVTAAGNKNYNNGAIYLGTGTFSDNGVPETTFSYIEQKISRGANAMYSVQSGYSLLIYPGLITVKNSQSVKVIIEDKNEDESVKYKSQIFESGWSNGSYNGFPILYPAKTDILVKTDNGSGSASVGLKFDLILLKDSLLSGNIRIFQ